MSLNYCGKVFCRLPMLPHSSLTEQTSEGWESIRVILHGPSSPTAAPTAPTHLIPTMYCVMWDDVFLILNTVSYEHKSLILDKPFNCLLKCLWKVVGEGSKGQGTPQMHWLDVGRVGGLAGSAGSLPELAEGKAGLHPGQLCHMRAHRYPAFWIDGWFFSLLPPLLWLEVLLLLPRTDETFRKYF